MSCLYVFIVPGFLCYVVLVIATTILIIFYIGPKYGHRNVVVYVTLCSAIGSLTVMSCKGLGLALKSTISGQSNELGNWLAWVLLIMVILCISMQMNYLNRALDLFNTGIVTPVYYVLFTSLVITASTILFREWQHLEYPDIIGSLCGFLVVIIAILLLNAFRDLEVSYSDFQNIMRPKRTPIPVYRDTNRLLHSDEESQTQPSERNYGSPGITQSI